MAGSLDGVRVAVVVGGDVGRSPRMCYHALSLADAGARVDLLGYAGARPPQRVSAHPRIRVRTIASPALAWRHRAPRPLFLLAAAARVLVQLASLAWQLLAGLPRPDLILVQTPPAVPVLPVALLCARLRRTTLAVDWHNLGYTLLALRLGENHALVRGYAWIERRSGRSADAHMTVSHAMADFLRDRWGVPRPAVLYDRPAEGFEPLTGEGRARALRDAAERVRGRDAGVAAWLEASARAGGERPLVLVSATSWTADEDMDLLLEGLRAYDARAGAAPQLPPLVAVVTGRGAGREAFEARVRELGLSRVRVGTAWLSAEGYRRLLGAADVGVCLHRSSSGLDLPMKLQDYLGAGLRVLALDYGPVLDEAPTGGGEVVRFRGAAALAARLEALAGDTA
jgi:beta-1,4-mannosyltransferase